MQLVLISSELFATHFYHRISRTNGMKCSYFNWIALYWTIALRLPLNTFDLCLVFEISFVDFMVLNWLLFVFIRFYRISRLIFIFLTIINSFFLFVRLGNCLLFFLILNVLLIFFCCSFPSDNWIFYFFRLILILLSVFYLILFFS